MVTRRSADDVLQEGDLVDGEEDDQYDHRHAQKLLDVLVHDEPPAWDLSVHGATARQDFVAHVGGDGDLNEIREELESERLSQLEVDADSRRHEDGENDRSRSLDDDLELGEEFLDELRPGQNDGDQFGDTHSVLLSLSVFSIRRRFCKNQER